MYSHPLKHYFTQNRDEITVTLSNSEAILKSCRMKLANILVEPWTVNLEVEYDQFKDAAEEIATEQVNSAEFLNFDDNNF